MSKTARVVNLLAVVLPPIVIALAIVVFWNDVVGLHDLALLAVMYVVTGFGGTVAFHRMLTHRSFRTSKPVEYLFAAVGSMAVQGPVINWVADHRKHHAHTDEEGDPHSPHVGCGAGLVGSCPITARPSARATPATSPRTPACARSTARSCCSSRSGCCCPPPSAT